MIEPQPVQVYVMIHGDYCSFHEASVHVVYDITNGIQLDEYTQQELSNYIDEESRSDVAVFDAVKIGDDYYVKL